MNNIKPQKIISILLAFALVAGCFAVMPLTSNAAPAKDNKNQDFTGTPVDVVAPEEVLVGEEAKITIAVENIANRGMPQVGIWVNGVRVAYTDEIGKGKSFDYTIDVDTSTDGEQSFAIVVWTRLGNPNFQDILFDKTVVVTVIAPEPEPLVNQLNDALAAGEYTYIFGSSPPTLTIVIDGVSYVFTANGNFNGNNKLECCDDAGVVLFTLLNRGSMTEDSPGNAIIV